MADPVPQRKPEPVRVRLRRLLLATKGGYASASKRLAVSKQALYAITSGGDPGLQTALAIQREYAIPASDWETIR